MLLLIAFVALASAFGFEAILGAFVAGAILKLVDTDEAMVHPLTRPKLEAIGFGFLVPVFFVASGLRFDLGALFTSASTVAMIPLFLLALPVVRGLPALLYRPLVGGRGVLPAALLEATSVSFIVAATQIGLEWQVIRPATAAALVAAGLLSVILFPPLALALIPRSRESAESKPLMAGISATNEAM